MLRFRHVLTTGAASFAGGALSLLLAFLAARLLSPAENGHYAQFQLVMNLLFIALNLGVGTSSTYHLASGLWTGAEIARVNLRFFALVAVAVALLGALAVNTGEGALVAQRLQVPLKVMVLGLVGGVLLLGVNQAAAILFGAHRYDRANLLSVVRAGFPLPLVLLAGVWAGGELPVVIAHVLALVAVLAMGFWMIRPQFDDAGAARQRNLAQLLRHGGITYLANVMHFAAMRGLLFVLSYSAGAEQVGFLNLALLLLEAMLLLPSAVGQLVFPQSSAKGFDRAQIEMVLRSIVYAGAVLALLVAALGEPVIVLALGEAYRPAGQALAHLAPSIVILAVPRVLSQVLVGQGHPVPPLVAASVSTLVGGLLAWWWIPRHGVIGGAWVSNAVALLTAAIIVAAYCRVQGTTVAQMLRPRRSDMQSLRLRMGQLARRRP